MTLERRRNILKYLRENLWVNLAIIGLALLSVGLLVYELSADLLIEQVAFIHTLDLIIAMIFLLDFGAGLYLSESRKIYFKQNWPDLLASIPITGGIYRSFRVLRLLRLIRVVRIIARIRRVAVVADKIADNSSKYIYIASITATVILAGAVSFFSVEFGPNPNVANFFDAVWWAVVTATTVGYGDIFPITWEGRLIGMVLMFFGIGLVGTTAGLVGNHFLNRRP
ncbi:hypothetical protein CVV38_04460 [Candidatus Peregrinibacteria bacterium HGW-Peregrinibacteria-1]|jgi:voltage-gated potassium channel|nr:MAG: hypothetical protein CVV38_04460 [Candidatus Peregrinibacteria bacterium HGW-Peregrinibacteria-1]